MIPTLEKFTKDLAAHDWTYAFSDDPRVYDRGERAERNLMSIARSGGDEYKRAFNTAHAKTFNTETFAKPYNSPFPEVQ